jgi:hypothetical protein
VTESQTPPWGPVEWEEGYAVVEVELSDGSRMVERIGDPSGHWRNPMSDEELHEKVVDCVKFANLDLDAQQIVDEVSGLALVERFTGLSSIAQVAAL